VVPLELTELASPEYRPWTTPAPCGVFVALHEPRPPETVAVQSVVEPSVKATVPVGGGPAEPTVAE